MNSKISKREQIIKISTFFNLSNKYIFIKLNASNNEQIFSISTSSVLFKGISNRNCIIVVKLLGLICNKILFKKKLSLSNIKKSDAKYSSKTNFFFNQIIKKVLF